MFPDNFVKVQKQTKKSIPPPPPSIKPKKKLKYLLRPIHMTLLIRMNFRSKRVKKLNLS